jgi:hypothetical protein
VERECCSCVSDASVGGVLRVWGESCRCVSDASVGGSVLLFQKPERSRLGVDEACAKSQPIGDSPRRRTTKQQQGVNAIPMSANNKFPE